jgi:GAF domain-containing protein
MKRRSKAGGEPIKGRRRKASEPKRRNAPKTVPRSKASPPGEQTEVARLTRERDEALEQQTATGDVLKIISRPSFDLQAVLDTLVKLAARLCEADLVAIHRPREGAMQFAANFGLSQEWEELIKSAPIVPGRGTATGRVLLSGKAVQIADVEADPEYTFTEGQRAGGFRTVLAVPLEREGETIGVIVLCRTKVHPFTDKQIALVQNFAAQAVIAIENARLLNELRQRTTDLTEALEQQTATSNVLQVISSSPGNLEPVFATMLENAVRLCDAKFGSINSWDGEALHLVATHNVPPAFAEFRKRTPFRPGPENPISQMLMTRTVIHFHNLATEQGYIDRNPTFVAAVELGGVRTFLAVPMMKENELIGVVIVYRQEVRPFSDKQIEVVKSFAAQAVIAIENARLLNELRQSLEQQTATADVLKVVSRSTFDLQIVLNALVETAARLCNADMGCIVRPQGSYVQFLATYGFSQDFFDVASSTPIAPGRWTLSGRVMEEGRTVHIHDVLADAEYTFTAAQQVAGFRSGLGVPLMREGTPIGVINLWRSQVQPFTEKQIELVTTFAAQAVIAIENTRLLKELRDRTEEVEKLNQHLEQRVADQVGEIERMSRLRRFLPPQVADLIVASGNEKQLESHRREITALFCDLRGFTGFTESADAEDVMALLRDYHAAIGEIIIKYNGTLERYAGDGVMVVFNDPVPVENPALQAVLMALEMRDAIGALTSKWHRFGHEIGFGIGIAHGFATLGTIGFEGRFDYAAIGTVSNVASRLCDEAKPGQILISPRVLVAVEKNVKVEPVGEFELKGIRRPLAAYNVVAALQSTGD